MTLTCLKHGPMKHRFALDWWECLGFDGEGCDATMIVYAEDIDLAVEVGDLFPGVRIDA